jgi:hypothetical protein
VPNEIDFGDGRRIQWTYTANGSKLERRVLDGQGVVSSKRYAGGFTYRDPDGTGSAAEALDFFGHGAGRVKYYAGSGGGSELIAYEYAFRDHLGNTRLLVDPADEFHSPYVYVGGDPVNLVDPDGRQVKNAEHWLGTPYGFLADGVGSDESPSSMDCKQLIYATYRDYGVDNFPETDMKLQTEWFKKHSEFTTDWSEGEAGDVVFVGTDGHVKTPQSRHNMIITDKRALESGEVQYKFIHASYSQKKVVTQGWTSRSSVEDHWGITRGQFVGIGKSPGNIVLPGINLLMHSSQRDASNPGQSDPSMLGRMARAVSSFMDALSPRESLGPAME